MGRSKRVVIIGVISALIWVITLVTLLMLITPLITTHEPPTGCVAETSIGVCCACDSESQLLLEVRIRKLDWCRSLIFI